MILPFKQQFVEPILNGPKIHTIREDKPNRWKAGNKIHAATGVRTSNYNCFFESKCVSVQTIVLQADRLYFDVWIDGRQLWRKEIHLLATQDDFKDLNELRNWVFGEKKDGHFDGNLIHWTNFKY